MVAVRSRLLLHPLQAMAPSLLQIEAPSSSTAAPASWASSLSSMIMTLSAMIIAPCSKCRAFPIHHRAFLMDHCTLPIEHRTFSMHLRNFPVHHGSFLIEHRTSPFEYCTCPTCPVDCSAFLKLRLFIPHVSSQLPHSPLHLPCGASHLLYHHCAFSIEHCTFRVNISACLRSRLHLPHPELSVAPARQTLGSTFLNHFCRVAPPSGIDQGAIAHWLNCSEAKKISPSLTRL